MEVIIILHICLMYLFLFIYIFNVLDTLHISCDATWWCAACTSFLRVILIGQQSCQ